MAFRLDPKLEADTVPVTDWPFCQVRLNRNSAFPWLVLVPRESGKREIIDLSEAQQQILWREIAMASRLMRDIYKADKLNVANLGNETAQLHVHVIARHEDDPAWPKPVWNSGVKGSYTDVTLEAELNQLRAAFAPAFQP